MKRILLYFLLFTSAHNLLAQNLLTNGDFESGNSGTGFNVSGSGYTPIASPFSGTTISGNYAVTTNPFPMNTASYIASGDHTTGTGNMLVIDGTNNGVGQPRFWETGNAPGGTICGLVVGASYAFSYWIKSVSSTVTNAASQADIKVVVSNATGLAIKVGDNPLAPLPAAGWQKVTYTFTTTAACVNIGLWNNNTSFVGNDFAIDDVSLILAPPTATIAGSTTVCLYSTPPNIVFTGANGIPPYTFVYNVDGGANQIITTVGANNSVNLPAVTSPVGTYNYNLVSVSYGTAPVVTEAQTGTATVIVNPLPTATIAGNAIVCMGSTGVVSFNGTPNATVTYTVNYGAQQTVVLNAAGTATVTSAALSANAVYSLVGVDSVGPNVCSTALTGSATLSVPTASIFSDTTINIGESYVIVFYGTPGATVNFTSSLGNASIVINSAGVGSYNIPYINATTTFTLVDVTIAGCTTALTGPLAGSVTVTVRPICATIATLPLAEVRIAAPSPVCNTGQCTDLLAEYTKISSTDDYDVCSVPYNPTFPFTGGALIPTGCDDVWAPAFTIPFQFKFYGQCYNQVHIGSNGLISFTAPPVNPSCAGLDFCTWIYPTAIPNAGFPYKNAIYGVFQDTNIFSPPVTDPVIQNINYYVLDTGVNAAPNRVFVVNFNELPQFSCNAGVGLQTSQIAIHETTNIIDVIVNKRTSCPGWNGGVGLIGIQNAAGTLGLAPPGRNRGTWAATNEAWRFVPKTTPVTATSELSWEDGGVAIPGSTNVNPLTVCISGPKTYTAVVKYTNCGAPTYVRQSVTVDVAAVLPLLDPLPITICTSALPPYPIDINQNAYMLSSIAPADQGNYLIKYYENPVDAENDAPTNINYLSDADLTPFLVYPPMPKTIYVRIEDFGTTSCYNVRSFTISVTGPSGTISYDAGPYCNNLPSASVTTHTLSAGGTYSASPAGLNIDPVTGAVTSGSTAGSYTVSYTVPASGTCAAYTTTTPIVIVNCSCTVIASSTSETLCINTPLTAITYTVTGGATGASISAGTLPAGITGNFAGGVYTLSGTPTAAGTYNFTVTVNSGLDNCASATTIVVNDVSTAVLTSTAPTTNQTVCINTPITAITYTIAGGATGASITGLPAGVTGTYAAGVFTISGSPSVAGPFNYTVTTSGGCSAATATGTITVNANTTIILSSAVATTSQTLCINTPITSISYTIANGGTGATVTGLPAGVTGAYAGGVFTISGSPSVAGPFNYTVTTSGGCGTASLSGTITVNPNATITLTSTSPTTSQTVCINTAITPITYTIADGGTGATVIGLPTGVTGTYAAGVFTISGSPSVSGPFSYTVTTSGGCSTAILSGTITVSPIATIVLSSALATTSQTICINTAITAITYNVGNGATGVIATGLPAGVAGTYAAGVFTISGSPSVAGPFSYTVTTSGGCGTASLSGTITVNPNATIALSSANTTTSQTVCINTAITAITYTIADGGTGATVTGLPAGVTGIYAAGVFTISGSPSVAGPFNYTVTTSGGCATASLSGTITVNPNVTITLTSAAPTTSQTVCINTAITAITYNLINTDATGATVTGLPMGVTGTYAAGVFTISGSPSVTGPFNYTVTTSGGCSTASLSGTITVNPNATIALSSAATTTSQTVCINTAITTITYTIADGGTGATVTGLPAGVAGTYAAGVFTISGSPSVAGPFSYTVITSGGCGTASLSGTITVNPNVTITLTSAAATTSQTVCINTAITAITYNLTDTDATGATVTGLPIGVTGTYAAGVFTISGSPSVTGLFNYTVTTSGGCSTASLSGTITVNPNATITLASAVPTTSQTVCINTLITPITYTIADGGTGATVTGLPIGVTGTYAGGVFTISGSASIAGPYNYTVTTSGGCGTASLSGTITVNPNTTIALSSATTTTSQTVCLNTAIIPITYAIADGGTGATVTGLPTGITGAYAAGVFTISGSSSVVGPYNYTVTTSGGCATASLSGTITVSPDVTIALVSAVGTTSQTLCINTAITTITYNVGNGATGATVTGLPTGVTGAYAAGVFTISGSPSTAGPFSYTVTTTGGCSTASLSGTITVNPNATIALSSGATTPGQTVCINTAIANITYTIADGGTGATVSGLPIGITGTFAGGVFTISGTPSIAGPYNYTVTTTGGCSTASLSGTITVNPNVTIALTSAGTTASQTVCINTAIVPITYNLANTDAIGATVTGLPTGVTGVYTAGVFRITGSPSVTGIFNYTITTSGGCSSASLSGSITISPSVTLALTTAASTANQTLCINTPLALTQYAIGNGATSAAITSGGLPAGVSGTFAAGVFSISGTPTASGTFNYVISTVGGCGTVTLSGSVIVKANVTLLLTSGAPTAFPTVCMRTPITPITYTIANGGTGATVTGLPIGMIGNYAGGIFTITGSATVAGTYPYTVTTSGGCSTASLSGSITVSQDVTIALTSATGTDNQEVCINVPITAIEYTVGNGATGASITSGSVPTGMQGSFAAGVFTLTGTPTQSGVFHITVTTLGGCSFASLNATITVDPLPVIHLEQNGFICVDDTGSPKAGSTFTLNTGLGAGYSYVWYNGTVVILGQNASSYEALEPATYTVEVTNNVTGCVNTQTATIVPSLPPLSILTSASSYFTENQVVSVIVAPTGAYEYQLDNGPFQTSNQFTNLGSGTHTIAVRDKFACGLLETTVRIIDYPRFFTPNGDGYNDTWNISDLKDQESSKIYIFDRYGKLLKEIRPSSIGWDGRFNSQELPATDYWFKVFYQESGIDKEFKSHFSIKR